MSILRPDRYRHTNPALPIVHGEDVKGAPRSVPDRFALYSLAAEREKLQAGVTVVRVTEDELNDLKPTKLLLVDEDNIGNASGWVVEEAGGASIDSFTRTGSVLKIGDKELDLNARTYGNPVELLTNNWSLDGSWKLLNGELVNDGSLSSGAAYQFPNIPFASMIEAVLKVKSVNAGYFVFAAPYEPGKTISAVGDYSFKYDVTAIGNKAYVLDSFGFDGVVEVHLYIYSVTQSGYNETFLNKAIDEVVPSSKTFKKTQFFDATVGACIESNGNIALTGYISTLYFGGIDDGGQKIYSAKNDVPGLIISNGYTVDKRVYFTPNGVGFGKSVPTTTIDAVGAIKGDSLFANDLIGPAGRMVQANGSGQLVSDANAPKWNGTNFSVNGVVTANSFIGEADYSNLPNVPANLNSASKLIAAYLALVNGAPAAYDTLKEIADYIASDKTGAAAMMTSLQGKANLDGGNNFTGLQKIAGTIQVFYNQYKTAIDFSGINIDIGNNRVVNLTAGTNGEAILTASLLNGASAIKLSAVTKLLDLTAGITDVKIPLSPLNDWSAISKFYFDNNLFSDKVQERYNLFYTDARVNDFIVKAYNQRLLPDFTTEIPVLQDGDYALGASLVLSKNPVALGLPTTTTLNLDRGGVVQLRNTSRTAFVTVNFANNVKVSIAAGEPPVSSYVFKPGEWMVLARGYATRFDNTPNTSYTLVQRGNIFPDVLYLDNQAEPVTNPNGVVMWAENGFGYAKNSSGEKGRFI